MEEFCCGWIFVITKMNSFLLNVKEAVSVAKSLLYEKKLKINGGKTRFLILTNR